MPKIQGALLYTISFFFLVFLKHLIFFISNYLCYLLHLKQHLKIDLKKKREREIKDFETEQQIKILDFRADDNSGQIST